MKKFYYAVQDEKNAAHVLTVSDGQNIAAIVYHLKLSIVHPCKNYAEAVKIVEAWKKCAEVVA